MTIAGEEKLFSIVDIKLFYRMNRINIVWDIINALPKLSSMLMIVLPTVQEIKKLIEYPDLTIKPLYYCLCQQV